MLIFSSISSKGANSERGEDPSAVPDDLAYRSYTEAELREALMSQSSDEHAVEYMSRCAWVECEGDVYVLSLMTDVAPDFKGGCIKVERGLGTEGAEAGEKLSTVDSPNYADVLINPSQIGCATSGRRHLTARQIHLPHLHLHR